jgi:hypothetical protein
MNSTSAAPVHWPVKQAVHDLKLLYPPNMPSDIKDKEGEPIQPGDEVMTKIRGGKREGEVDKIVTDEADAEKEGVKNPPKARPSTRTIR